MKKNIQTSAKNYIISCYRDAQINENSIKDNWDNIVTLDTKCFKDYFQEIYLGVDSKSFTLKEYSYEEKHNKIIVNFIMLQEEWTVTISSKIKILVRKV